MSLNCLQWSPKPGIHLLVSLLWLRTSCVMWDSVTVNEERKKLVYGHGNWEFVSISAGKKKKTKQNRKVILSTPVTWFMCIVTNKQEKLKTEGHITYSSALLFHIFVTASDTTWRVLLTDTAIISGNPWKSSWLNTGKYTLLPEWKQSLKGFCSIRSESSVFKKKKSITTVSCAIEGCKWRKGRKEKRRNRAPTLNFFQNLSTSSIACTTLLCRARGQGKKPIKNL